MWQAATHDGVIGSNDAAIFSSSGGQGMMYHRSILGLALFLPQQSPLDRSLIETFAIISLTLAAVAIGMVLAIFTMPGVWFMLGVAVLLEIIFADRSIFHPATLIALLAIAILGEIFELLASAVGASRAGGSRRTAALSVVGSLIGAIAGTFVIPIPIVGTIAGAAILAGLFAFGSEQLFEKRAMDHSMQVATGAAIGRLAATLVKVTVASVVGLALIFTAIYP